MQKVYDGDEGISLNYLQSLMLDVAGMKKTGYNRFLLDAMEKIPVITANGYIGADNNFYEIGDKSSPYYETIRMYDILVYNNLFDEKNRVNEFFEYGQ